MTPRLRIQGDGAVLVELGEGIDRAVSERVAALASAVEAAAIPGVEAVVPAFRSLMVQADPLAVDHDALCRQLLALAGEVGATVRPVRRVHVPVCYESEFAPDLAEVAAAAGLTPDEAAALHAGTDYHVYMLGFLPGFPYMGDLPVPLRQPRLATPRTRVPARSVAIANAMTAIYPLESPGGWRLIGRVPMDLFDPARGEPALLRPGDRVRFQPVDRAEFDRLSEAWRQGEGRLEVEEAGSWA